MTKPKSIALESQFFRGAQDYRSRLLDMAKKYQLVLDRVPVPGGGFVEAFRMALFDLSCFGERHLDLTGYPHESPHHALVSDWAALGADFKRAVDKVEAEAMAERGLNDGTGGAQREQLASRPAKAG